MHAQRAAAELARVLALVGGFAGPRGGSFPGPGSKQTSTLVWHMVGMVDMVVDCTAGLLRRHMVGCAPQSGGAGAQQTEKKTPMSLLEDHYGIEVGQKKGGMNSRKSKTRNEALSRGPRRWLGARPRSYRAHRALPGGGGARFPPGADLGKTNPPRLWQNRPREGAMGVHLDAAARCA
jgi:hypothetical protein